MGSPVAQIDNGVVVKIYKSIKEASVAVNVRECNIYQAIQKRCRAGEFKWKYHDDDIDPDEFWIKHPILEIECSSFGRVRQCFTYFGRMRGYKILGSGGQVIVIKNHGLYCCYYLVAETFHPNPDDKPLVEHLDGDYTNNNFWNLHWVEEI